MSHNFVFCIAFSSREADRMVLGLKRDAFSNHDISVLSAIGPVIAVLGDLVYRLFGMGVPLLTARLLDDRVKEGRTLVAVQTRGDEANKLAAQILRKAGGSDICTAEEPLERHRLAGKQDQLSGSILS